MPLAQRQKGPEPGKLLAWQILAPIGAAFVVLLLAAGLSAKYYFEPEARKLDLERAQNQTDFAVSAIKIHTVTTGQSPRETSRRLAKDFGFHFLDRADFSPPEDKPGWKTPRFAPSGREVEAWTTLRGLQGDELGAVSLLLPAHRTIHVHQYLRVFTLASCAVFALLFALAWLLLKKRVSDRLRAIEKEIDPSLLPVRNNDDAIGRLRQTVLSRLGKNQITEKSLRDRLDRHTELAFSSLPDGTILEANPACCRLFGLNPVKLFGTSYLDLIPPSERADAIAGLQTLSRGEPERVREHRVLLPDGTTPWTRWLDTAVFGPDGSLVSILSLGTDITREKEAHERNTFFVEAINQMQSVAHMGSLTWSLADDHMEWTEETFRLLGLDREEITPSIDRLIEFIAPNERESVRQLFDQAREHGRNFQRELYTALPDGSLRTLQIRTEVTADKKTKILNKLTATIQDITSLREAEAAMRRELHYRKAVESGVGIVVRDMSGRALSANPAFTKMVGFTEQELLAAIPPVEPYWPEEHRETIEQALREVLEGRTAPGGYELVFCRKNGERFEVLVNVAALKDDNNIQTGWLGAVTEISTLQQTRRELRSANARLIAALEAGYFGSFEHVFGVGALNWNEANYAIHGIDPSVIEPGRLFAAWKDTLGDNYPLIERAVASLPPAKTHLTYEYAVNVRKTGEIRHIRSSVSIERDEQGHPKRLVGICLRID